MKAAPAASLKMPQAELLLESWGQVTHIAPEGQENQPTGIYSYATVVLEPVS